MNLEVKERLAAGHVQWLSPCQHFCHRMCRCCSSVTAPTPGGRDPHMAAPRLALWITHPLQVSPDPQQEWALLRE